MQREYRRKAGEYALDRPDLVGRQAVGTGDGPWCVGIFVDGYELGIIRSLGGLDKDARKLVEEELRKRYVTPVIVEIKTISDRFDIVQWEVETNRGPKTFVTHSLYESLNESADSLIVTDMENNRYEIHDRSQLDSPSTSILTKRI